MKDNKIQYSVVVCSCNKLPYLKVVAQEIRKQLPDGELILSDDFSTDGTLEWAEGSGIFNSIVSQESDNGYCLSTIRNKGIDASTRDHIVLLDADCLPRDEYFAGHSSTFEVFPDCISVGVTHQYDKAGQNMLLEDHRVAMLEGAKTKDISWRDSFGGNIAFQKEAWNLVDRFDEDFNGAWGYEDLDFALRASKRGILLKLSRDAVVRHLQHPVNSAVDASNLKSANYHVFKNKYGFYPV